MKMNIMQLVVVPTISTVDQFWERVSSMGPLYQLYQVASDTTPPKICPSIANTPPKIQKILHQRFLEKSTTPSNYHMWLPSQGIQIIRSQLDPFPHNFKIATQTWTSWLFDSAASTSSEENDPHSSKMPVTSQGPITTTSQRPVANIVALQPTLTWTAWLFDSAASKSSE